MRPKIAWSSIPRRAYRTYAPSFKLGRPKAARARRIDIPTAQHRSPRPGTIVRPHRTRPTPVHGANTSRPMRVAVRMSRGATKTCRKRVTRISTNRMFGYHSVTAGSRVASCRSLETSSRRSRTRLGRQEADVEVIPFTRRKRIFRAACLHDHPDERNARTRSPSLASHRALSGSQAAALGARPTRR